jgi:hypothetical protein
MTSVRGRLLVSGRLPPGSLHFERGRITRMDLDADPRAGAELPVIAPDSWTCTYGFGGFDPIDELGAMARALTARERRPFSRRCFRRSRRASARWRRIAGASRRSSRAAPTRPRAWRTASRRSVRESRARRRVPLHELAEPSLAALRAILGPATGGGRGIRTVTLAPELPGSAALIGRALFAGRACVSLGQSSATAEDARRAAKAGAKGATHLFNAMGRCTTARWAWRASG